LSCAGAALLISFVAAQATSGGDNPYLGEAIRQLRALDERAALETLAKAESWPRNTPQQLALVHLYVGLAHAGLNEKLPAEDAFRNALLLDPGIVLPNDVSPVVKSWWREAGGSEHVPPAPPPTAGSSKPMWLVPAGLAAAFAVGAGVCYGESLSRYQALTGPQSMGRISPSTEHTLQSQGQIYQTLAFVGLGAAIVGAGTAVVTVLTSGPPKPSVTVRIAVSPTGLSFSASLP
jgi:hypothetical protein